MNADRIFIADRRFWRQAADGSVVAIVVEQCFGAPFAAGDGRRWHAHNRSGGTTVAVPPRLPHPDAPAVPAAGVSAPEGRPVETSARGQHHHRPETSHV